jgi:hypothetical protein
MAPGSDGDAPVEGERPDPGVPLLLKAIWAAFALWAVVYVVLYLVPEFREWRAGR